MNCFSVHIGESLNIQLASTGQRCWGEVVGVKEGKYLLIETGKSQQTLAFVPEDTVTVRCVSKGNGVLCGFRTTVARYLTEPFSQVILHFPQEVERMQLRNESRYSCFCPVAVHYGDQTNEGMLINVSEHGGKILLAAPPSCGETEAQQCPFIEDQKISLEITPFGATEPVVIETAVKRIVLRDGAITLGVFWDQVSAHEELFLEFMDTCKKFNELS